MNITDIFNKQNNNISLSFEELSYIVNGYVNGEINDNDMATFLKNVCDYNMSEEETIMLTKIMLNSGDKLDLSDIDKIKVDKHSTGGVGDKVTLIVSPIVAACGVPVCKMSGRSLGFTGGTIDKLESIPGFNVSLELNEFINQVKNINIAISSQTGNLVPADKKIYALRDVTNTVESIPLIASSIMSKKLASGADKIVLDVKVGEGALMKDIESARKLATLMVRIGNENGKETIAILTNMDNPLGYNIGNSLEVIEAIDILKNTGESRLKELCISIASYMVMLGKNISLEDARKEVIFVIEKGEAFNKFMEFVSAQGGNINKLPAANKFEFISKESGYITDIKAIDIGKYVMNLGAGRKNKGDSILYNVGIVLNKKVGDYIKEGELLTTVYSEKSAPDIYNLIKIGKEKPVLQPIIYEIIR